METDISGQEDAMARKAKSKSGIRKTRAAKPAAKFAKKMLPATPRDVVAVISTITFSKEMKQAIATGVANPNIRLKFVYVGSYKKPKLTNRLSKFDNNGRIKLVVTVGGNKAYEAAKSTLSNKPFVSLVGTTPNTPRGMCMGGVTLGSPDGNQARVDHLVSLGATKNKIGLLCNPNSTMHPVEKANWTDPKGIAMAPATIFPAGKSATDENDSDTYEAAFEDIVKAGMQAVIVSADPFFQDTMDELVAAANDSGVHVTYPLQNYKNAWESPTPGNAIFQGPDLLTAYGQLGSVASLVLATGRDQGFPMAISTIDPP